MNSIITKGRLLFLVIAICMLSSLEAQSNAAPADTTSQLAQLPQPVITEEPNEEEEEKKESSLLIDRKLIIDYKTWSIRLVKQEH